MGSAPSPNEAMPSPSSLTIKILSPDRPLDLTVEPPPDLVIEVDISRSSLDKLPIYVTLGVPEIWRYTDGQVELQYLTEGAYAVADTRQVLPGIHADLLTRFIDEARTATNQTRWFKEVVAVVSAQS